MWAFWIFLGLALLDMEYQNMICSIFCSVGLKGYSVLNFKKTLNISYFEVYSNNVGSKSPRSYVQKKVAVTIFKWRFKIFENIIMVSLKPQKVVNSYNV